MYLTASIVTYRTDSKELTDILTTLENSPVEVVWIVDNSRCGYIESLAANFRKVRYIPSENRGYGAGNNIAIREAMRLGARYHLVLNSDLRFDGSQLSRLTDFLDADERVACVHPRVVGTDGRLQYTVRMLPTPFDLFGRRFLPSFLMKKRTDSYELHFLDHARPFNVPYHQGSFMMLRLEALKTTGLFDEHFFMYAEDVDLTRRIHQYFLTVYYPAVTVVHAHRKASYHSWKMLWIHSKNMVMYFNKWGWIFDAERRRVNHRLRHSGDGTYLDKPQPCPDR